MVPTWPFDIPIGKPCRCATKTRRWSRRQVRLSPCIPTRPPGRRSGWPSPRRFPLWSFPAASLLDAFLCERFLPRNRASEPTPSWFDICRNRIPPFASTSFPLRVETQRCGLFSRDGMEESAIGSKFVYLFDTSKIKLHFSNCYPNYG